MGECCTVRHTTHLPCLAEVYCLPCHVTCHSSPQHSTCAHTPHTTSCHTTAWHEILHTTSRHITCHVIFLTGLSLSHHPHLSFPAYLPKRITVYDIVLDPRDLGSIPNSGTKSKTFSRGCTPPAEARAHQRMDYFGEGGVKTQYGLAAALQGWPCAVWP